MTEEQIKRCSDVYYQMEDLCAEANETLEAEVIEKYLKSNRHGAFRVCEAFTERCRAELRRVKNGKPSPDFSFICCDECFKLILSETPSETYSVYSTTADEDDSLGLVTYAACERHQDPADPERVRNYTNVYRINLDKLREFFPDTGEWRRKVLGIHDDANISEGVLRALKAYDGRPCSVREADSPVQNLDSPIQNLDTAVQNLDTYTNTDKKEDKNFTATLIKRMADVLGIPSFLIMRSYVENAIRGKYSESVLGLVEGLPTDRKREWVLTADDPIRALVSQLRKLPKKEDDPEWRRRFDPTPEQLLEDVPSPDVCDLTKWAMSATGCRDAKRFVKRLIDILGGLLQQETGREHAVETIAEIEKMKISSPGLKAGELLARLRGPRG